MATRRISERVWQVGGSLMTHPCDCSVYLIRGESNVLIDCGNPDGLGRLIDNLKEIDVGADEISAVVGTHCHFDHVGAFRSLKEHNPYMMLVLNDLDREAVQVGDPEKTVASWMFGAQFPAVGVNRAIKGREQVQFEDVILNCIPTPGHSPGSMAVRFAEQKGPVHLFVGDCLVPSSSRTQGDFEFWLDTLEVLAGVESDLVHLGHNTRTGSMKLLPERQARFEKKAFERLLLLRFAPRNLLQTYWRLGAANYDSIMPLFDPMVMSAMRGVNFLIDAVRAGKDKADQDRDGAPGGAR